MSWLAEQLQRLTWVQWFINWTRRRVLPGFGGLPIHTVAFFFGNELKKEALFTKASSLAFNFLLAIFPFIIFLFTLIPLIPIPEFQDELLKILKEVFPPDAYQAAESTIRDIVQNKKLDLLSIGFVASVYFSTNGVATLMKAFNKSSLLPETRPFFRRLWVSFSLTFVMAVLIVLATAFVIFSQVLIEWLLKNEFLERSWRPLSVQIACWTIVSALYLLAVSILYYYGPAKQKCWRFFTPGSIMATVMFILSSIGFTYYVANFAAYNKLYGSIGTVVGTMIWLFINSWILLLGFELNASIELSKRSIQVKPPKIAPKN